jgi:hypothetical protein
LVAIATGAAAVIVAIAVVAYLALQPAEAPPSGEPFTLAGTLKVVGNNVKTVGLPNGYKCAGAKEFGDIAPDAPITIEDESGTLLAKGAFEGSTTSPDGCRMEFQVGDVPSGARFYRVQVGEGHERNFTESEAKAGVEFLMGTVDDPTTTRQKPAPTPTPTRTVTVAPTPDMEKVSLTRLQNIADGDRSDVAVYLADRWIPQISSKRVGLEAKGITWDNRAILDEHLRLRNIYPDVKLLWSGDWSTYDGPNFWVTVVGLQSYNPYDVLDWCTEQGFDRDNCIAKLVSTTHPIEGSTKLNP